jgi:diadenosine tetraphosphate (Ap4A) HIT family hydrolase
MSDICMICDKHSRLEDFTGLTLADRGGFLLTHFPVLDGERATRGHLLIETKRHITDLTELNFEEAAALGTLIRDGAEAIREICGAEHVYLFRINDQVKHLHFHLVPRYPQTPREVWGQKIMSWTENPNKISLSEVKLISEELRSVLE